jgi:hypothetical protein
VEIEFALVHTNRQALGLSFSSRLHQKYLPWKAGIEKIKIESNDHTR